MACAQNNSHLYSYNHSGTGLSAWYGILSCTYGYLDYNTAMFSYKLDVKTGYLKAPYIFIDKNCEVTVGDSFLLSGKVYLVDTKTFNDIYWLWTNSAMRNYIEEHDLKGIEYHNEIYATHAYELLKNLGDHQELGNE